MHRFSFRPQVERLEALCLPAFLNQASYAANASYPAVANADFNNDGRPDLVVVDLADHDAEQRHEDHAHPEPEDRQAGSEGAETRDPGDRPQRGPEHQRAHRHQGQPDVQDRLAMLTFAYPVAGRAPLPEINQHLGEGEPGVDHGVFKVRTVPLADIVRNREAVIRMLDAIHFDQPR